MSRHSAPRRALAGFLCIALLATAAVACGGGNGTPAEPATAPPAPEMDTPEEAEGGGEERGQSDGKELPPPTPGQVRAVIGAFVTSSDPAVVCEAVVSDRFVQAAFGDRQGCRAALTPDSVADRVEVRAVRILNGTATAIAVPRGGVNNGLEVAVELVAEKGALVIDRFEADVPPGP